MENEAKNILSQWHYYQKLQKPSNGNAMVSGGTERTTVEQLQQNLHAVNNEIIHLQAQGLKVEELQLHIDKLHEYNELKDLGQLVIGRLANLRGITTRDLYTEYGLKLED